MKSLLTVFLVLIISISHAQEYYYNGNEKVIIYPALDAYLLFENEALGKSLESRFGKTESFAHKGYTLLEGKENGFSMQSIIKENPKNISSAYSIERNGNFKMFPTKTVRIKMKSGRNQKDLSAILGNYDVANIEEKYGIIRVHINDIRQIFQIANIIFESGLAEFSLPDFYIEKKLNQVVNDPLFPLQFQMNNTGQVIDGIPGVNDIDCNALEAWNMALGNNVMVAVIDQGLEAHEDFGNRLIGGHTPVNNGNGTPVLNGDTHGMNSAGVLAASGNNLGIRGVAPNASLLSVNIFAGGETNGDLADGITWAVNNGADVISNSWGFPSCTFTSVDIDNAILYAVTSGRGGDGSVIVFAAGNGGACVEYPARNPNVIAVGAIDNQGNQYGYSARGPELDLVAPSGNSFGGIGVRTLDRMGIAGDFAGNYRDNFDGTSAAAPVVAGVAALVLSVNPNMTQQQVRDILINTAIDMGANGFDNNFGNGRVNACAAVQAAMSTISGPDLLCSTSSYTLLNVPGGSTVTWSVNGSRLFSGSTSGIGNTANLSPANSSSSGQATLTFTIATACGEVEITKDIWVGKPQIIYSPPGQDPCTSNPFYSTQQIPGVTYTWSVDNPNVSLTSNGTHITAVLSNNPEYFNLTLTISDGICTTSQTLSTYTDGYYCQCFSDPSCGNGGFGFAVFPNPVSDELTVMMDSEEKEANQNTDTQFEVKLFDVSGNELYSQTTSVSKTTLNVRHLKNGFYYLHIRYKDALIRKQIRIER